MLVVSDTSPIINLAVIGYLHLLPDLFTEIVIPGAVFEEVTVQGKNQPGSNEIKTAAWVKVLPAPTQPLLSQLLNDLDPGEAEAIALALEIAADFILIDETLGRAVAKSYHLHPLGLLGILVMAKQKGLINAVTPLMDRLQEEADFFIDGKLYQRIRFLTQE